MISFVIPTKNNETTLQELFLQIYNQCDQLRKEFEVIFIDHGSRDGTWDLLRELSEKFPKNVRAIQLRSQSSVESALRIGFHKALGDLIFTMSADLKDDPVAIPRFIKKLDEGVDVVVGYKQHFELEISHFSFKRLLNKAVSKMSGVNLNRYNSNYSCYRSEVIREMSELVYGSTHKKFPLSAKVDGYKVAEIKLVTRSKTPDNRYNLLEYFTLNFLNQHTEKPQRVIANLTTGFLITGLLFVLLAQSGIAHSELVLLIGSGLLFNVIPLAVLGIMMDMQFSRMTDHHDVEALSYNLVTHDTTVKFDWTSAQPANDQIQAENIKVF